jgi:hypothetical protein
MLTSKVSEAIAHVSESISVYRHTIISANIYLNNNKLYLLLILSTYIFEDHYQVQVQTERFYHIKSLKIH